MDWGFEGEDDGAAESHDDERPAASDGVRFIGETDDEEAEPDRPRIREGRGGRDEGRGEARGEGREARDNGNGEDGGRGRRRRRRRGRRGGERNGRGEERADDRGEIRAVSNGPDTDDGDEGDDFGPETAGEAELIETAGEEASFEDRGPAQAGDGGRDGDRGGRRRRRGRRGGRRGRGRDRDQNGAAGAGPEDANGYPVRAHVTEDFVDDFAGPAGVDTDPESSDNKSANTRLPVYEAPALRTPPYVEPDAQPDPVVNAAPRRRVTEPTTSEPKIERVVVTPDQAQAAASETVSEQPVRKGWWQRRLGT